MLVEEVLEGVPKENPVVVVIDDLVDVISGTDGATCVFNTASNKIYVGLDNCIKPL